MKWEEGNKSKLELKILPKESESQQGTTKKMLATLQQAKRFLRILFGFTLLAIGAVMILTPGPGWLTIMLGLGALAPEYVWAPRLLDKMKEQGLRLRDVFPPRPRQTTGPA